MQNFRTKVSSVIRDGFIDEASRTLSLITFSYFFMFVKSGLWVLIKSLKQKCGDSSLSPESSQRIWLCLIFRQLVPDSSQTDSKREMNKVTAWLQQDEIKMTFFIESLLCCFFFSAFCREIDDSTERKWNSCEKLESDVRHRRCKTFQLIKEHSIFLNNAPQWKSGFTLQCCISVHENLSPAACPWSSR